MEQGCALQHKVMRDITELPGGKEMKKVLVLAAAALLFAAPAMAARNNFV